MLTARIEKIRHNYVNAKPQISCERATLWTESYKKSEGKPVCIRSAQAFYDCCAGLGVHIFEGELIVGAIGEYRKGDKPRITGYEFHVINLVSQVCPHYLIKPYLEETLEELKTREPEEKFPFRARVALVGSEVDDPAFTKLLEDCGAYVVADRYCYGSLPGREEIIIRDGESAFDAIVRHYLHWNQCARFMEGAKIDQRHAEVKRLVDEFHADGVIYENMKFCEFWSYEKVLASHILTEEMGVPCCTIEKEYALGSIGQLRTRFQAFVESLEIKKINS